MTSASYLITGDDPSLVSETLSRLLEKLCGDDFVPIEEHGGDGEDSIDLGPSSEPWRHHRSWPTAGSSSYEAPSGSTLRRRPRSAAR